MREAIIMLWFLSIFGVWMTYNFETFVSPILTTIFSSLILIHYFRNLNQRGNQ